MKKYLSMLLVVALAISLAVPAFAAEDDYVIRAGKYGLKLFIDRPLSDADFVPELALRFVSNGETCKSIYFYGLAGTNFRFTYMLENSDSGKMVYRESDNPNMWLADEYRTIDVLSDTVVSAQAYAWFTANAMPFECDGSSCPATDVNYDDVCDDCGAPLAYNLRQTPNSVEVVVKHSDSLTLKYVYTETLAGTAFNAVYADDRVTVTFDNPVNHTQYKKVGDDWELYSTLPNQRGNHVISLSGDASISNSDLDVYNTDGTLFFRNPLWMVVEKVTQGEMKDLLTETGGTMKTLLACGVGCLALLVVLSLFGKRSLIFRG